jgi:two-component system cell cycle response regulator
MNPDPIAEIEQLKTELCILESHLSRLLTCIRQNEEVLRRFQSLEAQFLSLNFLRELVEHVLEDTRTVFEMDFVTFALVDPKGKLKQFLQEDGLILDKLKELILFDSDRPLKPIFGKAFRPYLGPVSSKHRALFPYETLPASCALLPLVRRGELLGALSLGSHEPSRFTLGMATDFLDRLRQILAVCLDNTLNFELLRRTSLIDPLTGVNNRRFFEQRLGEEIDRALRTGEPLACLFLDIDHFKQINDTYGHQTGDLVLAEIAAQIRSQLRSQDVLARYGGEEFVALLSSADERRAQEVAERIRKRIEAHRIVDHNDQVISVTLSIGVAEYDPSRVSPMSEVDQQRFLELADQALYAAKRSGRNRVMSGGVYLRPLEAHAAQRA